MRCCLDLMYKCLIARICAQLYFVWTLKASILDEYAAKEAKSYERYIHDEHGPAGLSVCVQDILLLRRSGSNAVEVRSMVGHLRECNKLWRHVLLEFVLHDRGGHCKADRSTQSADEVSVGDDHSSLRFSTMRLKGGDRWLEDAPYADAFDQED